MSREERRAYQRMTKKQDPYALPANGAAKARMERQQRVRARRAAAGGGEPGAMSRRFLLWAVGGGVGAGLVAFSLAWPHMPLAAYVGIGVAVAWAGALFGARFLLGRGPARS